MVARGWSLQASLSTPAGGARASVRNAETAGLQMHERVLDRAGRGG